MVHIKVGLIFLRLQGTNTSRPVVPSISQQWINSLGVWRVEWVYVPCHVNLGWVWVIFAGLTNYREICWKVTVYFFLNVYSVLKYGPVWIWNNFTVHQGRGIHSKAIIRIQKGPNIPVQDLEWFLGSWASKTISMDYNYVIILRCVLNVWL